MYLLLAMLSHFNMYSTQAWGDSASQFQLRGNYQGLPQCLFKDFFFSLLKDISLLCITHFTDFFVHALTILNRARCAQVSCARVGINVGVTNNNIGILIQHCIIMWCILLSGRKWVVGGCEGVTFLFHYCWLLISHCRYHNCIQDLVTHNMCK